MQAVLLLATFTEQHQITPGGVWAATRSLRFPAAEVGSLRFVCTGCIMCLAQLAANTTMKHEAADDVHSRAWSSAGDATPQQHHVVALPVQVDGEPMTDEQRRVLRADFVEIQQALFTAKGFWNQFHKERENSAEYWPVRDARWSFSGGSSTSA